MTSVFAIEYFGKNRSRSRPWPVPNHHDRCLDSFAIDAAGIELGIHHVVGLATGLQQITRARGIRYLDGGVILI